MTADLLEMLRFRRWAACDRRRRPQLEFYNRRFIPTKLATIMFYYI